MIDSTVDYIGTSENLYCKLYTPFLNSNKALISIVNSKTYIIPYMVFNRLSFGEKIIIGESDFIATKLHGRELKIITVYENLTNSFKTNDNILEINSK